VNRMRLAKAGVCAGKPVVVATPRQLTVWSGHG